LFNDNFKKFFNMEDDISVGYEEENDEDYCILEDLLTNNNKVRHLLT